MRDGISQALQLPCCILKSLLTGSLILMLIANFSYPLQSQSIKTDRKSPPGAGKLSGKPDTEQLSPSLIIVPNGMAAVTSTGAAIDGGLTLRVVDITQFGSLWTPANFAPNYIASAAQMPLMNSWTPSQFSDSLGDQSMRGLAISADGTKVYVGTSGYVAGTNKTPNIYRIGPTSTTPMLLSALPSYAADPALRRGIAALDLDETHNVIFASNYSDGIIYRVNATTPGPPIDSFDPLGAYSGGASNTFPPLGERVVAVSYNHVENCVYYAMWGSGATAVRSIRLTATGAFDPPTDRLEFTITSNAPVTDIEFNNAGTKMLLAEENLTESGGNIFLGAHGARALEYTGSTGAWLVDPTTYPGTTRKYSIGGFFTQTNCRGGVAWAYSNITGSGIISGNESFVMFTGDALRLDSVSVYGFQYTPSTGGAAAGTGGMPNSLIADLDYTIVGNDKMIYGDVDIRRNLSPNAAETGISGRVLSSSGYGISKASVILTNVMGETKAVLTNPFGYYKFEGLRAGETYFLSVSAKSYRFNTRTVTLNDELTGIDFVAQE